MLNQLALVYDTRDDTTIPSRGTQWVAYAGVNGHDATISDSIYSDGRDRRADLHSAQLRADTVLAAHAAVRYLPSGHEIPFYDLSSIGGGESDIGGEQLLRGFGQGRFVDRNSYSASFELRAPRLLVRCGRQPCRYRSHALPGPGAGLLANRRGSALQPAQGRRASACAALPDPRWSAMWTSAMAPKAPPSSPVSTTPSDWGKAITCFIAPLRLLSSMAAREVLAELIKGFTAESGQAVTAEAAGGVEVAKRIQGGDAADVVVLSDTAIDKLIAGGAAAARPGGPGEIRGRHRGAQRRPADPTSVPKRP